MMLPWRLSTEAGADIDADIDAACGAAGQYPTSASRSEAGPSLQSGSAPGSTVRSHILPGVELGRYAADGHHGRNLSETEHNGEVLKQEAVVDATS